MSSADHFAERLLRALDAEIASLTSALVSGSAGGDRYHALTGHIRGLRQAAERARELIAPELDATHPLRKHGSR